MIQLPQTMRIDRDIFSRYSGLSLPRHVSYPMPTWWEPLGAEGAAAIRSANTARADRLDLSLYFHIPFCEALCKFCACNRVIARRDGRSSAGRVEAYLDAMEVELDRRAADSGARDGRPVRQIHWGGGTPTYLDCFQIERLHRATTERFEVASDAEISIEIDPRVTSRDQLNTLRRLGFNRVSLGVQDFDPQVQEHVRRVQPLEMVRQCVDDSRAAGFESVNFDLIYGLPMQTVESVRDTVQRAIGIGPDRIAFYHYAQIPDKIAHQRAMDHSLLPDSDAKLTMFLDAIGAFEAGGYEFIGLDHFAKSEERLAVAKREGTLNRNFQGMTTGADLDLIGVGASSISVYPGEAYLQNMHEPEAYVQMMASEAEPAIRGLSLTADDAMRQWMLLRLYGEGAVRAGDVSERWKIDFAAVFAGEIERLRTLERDGLVTIDPDGSFSLTHPLGRVLMRNVAAVFDAHLDPEAFRIGQEQTFSKNG